jgi:hypothetical protein
MTHFTLNVIRNSAEGKSALEGMGQRMPEQDSDKHSGRDREF